MKKNIKGSLKRPLRARYSSFRPKIRSRHPSHSPLRSQLPLLPFRSVIRLGSTTRCVDSVSNGGNRIECNTIEAVKNSANKLLMKRCFEKAGVVSATWCSLSDFIALSIDEQAKQFPVVVKSHMGSRGMGNTLIKTQEAFNIWVGNKTIANYIVERFHDYSREYRLHVTKEGCFYTCRKMLKSSTPEKDRWFRNDSNSSWMVENNPLFNKPVNWIAIINECVKALNAVGLDVGACDVKVQSAKDKKGNPRPTPEFIIIEINSAPAFGEGTLKKYIKELPAILMSKKQG